MNKIVGEMNERRQMATTKKKRPKWPENLSEWLSWRGRGLVGVSSAGKRRRENRITGTHLHIVLLLELLELNSPPSCCLATGEGRSFHPPPAARRDAESPLV